MQPINDDCMYVTYKNKKEFHTPALNTNVAIVSYVTTHAKFELYSYLEKLDTFAIVTPILSFTNTKRDSTTGD